jgi:GNAT superfamily N-acetyltransferase
MHAPISRDELLRIEQAEVAAWPALETADIDGWLWRYSGGGSQRANSVSPLVFRGADVEAAIGGVEARYRSRDAKPMFQICDVSTPADLDERLQRRGYRLQEPCTALAKRIAPAASAMVDADIEIGDAPSEAWLSVYLAGITASRRDLAPLILARVPAPRAFLLLRDRTQPAATALCVVANGVAIAECVMTRADRRRSGAADRVMRALETWGARQGATLAALQAVTANAPAQALYAKLAYARVGGYHYRVLDT